jgi:hypothetical protein
VRDLGGRQAAHRAERERHLRGAAQHRVAAEQQQGEAVVGLLRRHRPPGGVLHRQVGAARLLLPPAPGLIGAEQIHHPPVSDPDQPAARIVRHSVPRPRPARGEQRLLHRVLGDVEATEAPHQRAEHLRRLGAQQVLDVRGHAVNSSPMIGRISIGSPSTSTMRETISTARSWLTTSITAKLASTSLSSANGPSVATTPSGDFRTVVLTAG